MPGLCAQYRRHAHKDPTHSRSVWSLGGCYSRCCGCVVVSCVAHKCPGIQPHTPGTLHLRAPSAQPPEQPPATLGAPLSRVSHHLPEAPEGPRPCPHCEPHCCWRVLFASHPPYLPETPESPSKCTICPGSWSQGAFWVESHLALTSWFQREAAPFADEETEAQHPPSQNWSFKRGTNLGSGSRATVQVHWLFCARATSCLLPGLCTLPGESGTDPKRPQKQPWAARAPLSSEHKTRQTRDAERLSRCPPPAPRGSVHTVPVHPTATQFVACESLQTDGPDLSARLEPWDLCTEKSISKAGNSCGAIYPQ